LIIGIFISVLALVALYIGFSELLVDYVNMTLLPTFVVTVLLIGLIALFACYWPLRQFIYRPAIHSLRGND